MSGLMEERDNVLSFNLFKIEKGREKICKCSPPRYEVDTVNRIVSCVDCGATLDAFDALASFCSYIKELEEYQEKALERVNLYRELAEEEGRRRFRYRAFKEMDAKYSKGMLPNCPRCGGMFDPAKINRWTNERYYREGEVPE